MKIQISAQRKAQIKLLLLVLIFVLPFLVAQGLYLSGWRPSHYVNHGALLKSPLSVTELQLSGVEAKQAALPAVWLLMYVAPQHCDETCQKTIYVLRQIRLSLGKDSDRVARVLILPPNHHLPLDDVQKRYPDLLLAKIPQTGLTRIQQGMTEALGEGAAVKSQVSEGVVLIADPNAHIVMAYPAVFESRDVFADLQHLLKYSHLG